MNENKYEKSLYAYKCEYMFYALEGIPTCFAQWTKYAI